MNLQTAAFDHPGLSDATAARVADRFRENFELRGDIGASVSIWKNGREVLSLADGFCDRQRTRAWTAQTPVLAWSATKGPAAACALHCLERHGIPLGGRVAEIWPEFAQPGKENVTLAQLLSHQAGLAALDREVSPFDYDGVVRALASQAPNWPPGEGHGYHPRTFGWLLDEIVRHLCGSTLGDYWRMNFAGPLGLDFWIGVPEEKLDSIAPVFPARQLVAQRDAEFYKALGNPASLSARAFASPHGLHSIAAMNSAEARRASFPGFGGIGTARSLAKFYAMLAHGGALDGTRFFSPRTLALMTTTLTSGHDRVLQMETALSAGFMRDPIVSNGGDGKKSRAIFGPSLTAFGHPGAGGSVAFADPENGIAFAYVMNQMEPGVLPNEKSLLLIDALYA